MIEVEVEKTDLGWYEMEVTIEDMVLKMDFTKMKLSFDSLYNFIELRNNKLPDGHPDKIKKLEKRTVLKWYDVRRMIEEIDRRHLAAAHSGAVLGDLAGSTHSDALTAPATMKIGKEWFIHPYVALAIMRKVSVQLEYQMYEVFIKNKVMERRNEGRESFTNFKKEATRLSVAMGASREDAWNYTDNLTRQLSNAFNAKMGIQSIRTNEDPAINKAREKFFELVTSAMKRGNGRVEAEHIELFLDVCK